MILHSPLGGGALEGVWVQKLSPDALDLVRATENRGEARTKRKATAATGNGKQLRLRIGVNVVDAATPTSGLGARGGVRGR